LVEVNGAELHVEEQGTGRPVLFVHGTGASAFIWERALPHLPEGHRLITYDRRGFGRSAGPPARRFGDHAADAAELLRHLDASPAVIVSQSGGGPIALRLAVDQPESVQALVIAEPAYQVLLHPSVEVMAALAKTLGRWLLLRDPIGAAVSYYRWAARLTTGGNNYDAFPEEWRSTARAHAATTLREVLQLIPPSPSRRKLRRLSCPTTIVFGDVGVPVFRRTSATVQRLVPAASRVTITDTSHLIPADQPVAFAAAVTDALGFGTRTGDVPPS
jgi:pimeloyl-ACP methyl ester carboxylesterase